MKVSFEYSEEPKTRIINGLPYLSTNGINDVDIEISTDISDFKNAATFIRTMPADCDINICVFNEKNEVVVSVDYWGEIRKIIEFGNGHCVTYKVTETRPANSAIVSNILAHLYSEELEEAYNNMISALTSSKRP